MNPQTLQSILGVANPASVSGASVGLGNIVRGLPGAPAYSVPAAPATTNSQPVPAIVPMHPVDALAQTNALINAPTDSTTSDTSTVTAPTTSSSDLGINPDPNPMAVNNGVTNNSLSTKDLYAARDALQNKKGDVLTTAIQSGIPYSPTQLAALHTSASQIYDPAIANVTAQIQNAEKLEEDAASKSSADSATQDQVDALAQQVASGANGATLASVPSALRAAVALALQNNGFGASAQDQMLQDSADSLKNLQDMVDSNTGFTSAVGAKGFLSGGLDGLLGQQTSLPSGEGGGGVSGSKRADFENAYAQTINQVVLPNLNLLHGLGRVTQKEFDTLSSAVSALKLSSSETEFKTQLASLTKQINDKIAEKGGTTDTSTIAGGSSSSSGSTSSDGLTVTAPDGSVHTFLDTASADNFKKLANIQ